MNIAFMSALLQYYYYSVSDNSNFRLIRLITFLEINQNMVKGISIINVTPEKKVWQTTGRINL